MARDRRDIAAKEEVSVNTDTALAAPAIDIHLANRIEEPHPMLIALVQAMARHAARMDCAAQDTDGTDD